MTPIERAARAAWIEDQARRMRNSVSSVHAYDAYCLERQRAAEGWDDPRTLDGVHGRPHWRDIARAAIAEYLRARADEMHTPTMRAFFQVEANDLERDPGN